MEYYFRFKKRQVGLGKRNVVFEEQEKEREVERKRKMAKDLRGKNIRE